MAIVPAQGVSPSQGGVQTGTGQGGPGSMQVTVGPAVKDYPFTDAVFQIASGQLFTGQPGQRRTLPVPG